MKRISQLVAITVATLAIAAGPLHAQSGNRIAVLDVAKVFKSYTAFKQRLDGVKNEVKAFEGEINQQRQMIADQGKKLQQYQPGSFEYKQIEEKVARDMSDLKVRAELKRKDVLEREAKIYYEAYNSVVEVVTRIADRHGIGLVLRYDSAEIDPANPRSVMAGVSRPVVFQRNLDLTSLVVDELNRTASRPVPPRR